ncbi:MAG: Loki-CTERM sorting domain-containing protein [Candidatus Hodarchaeales archaeon]
MFSKRISILFCLTLLLVGMVGVPATQAVTPHPAKVSQVTGTIKVGVLAPISGDLESVGVGIMDGIKAAALEVNNSDAFAFDIFVFVEDTKVDPTIAVTAYEALKAQGVELIIGAAASAASKPVAEKAAIDEIVQISYASTGAVLSSVNYDYFWRVVPSDLLQSQAINDILEEESLTEIVLINRADDWGKGLKDGVTANYDGTIADTIEYPSGTTDFASVVTGVKAATDAQAIVMVSFTEDGRGLVTELRSSGVDLPIIGADGTGDAAMINETFSADIKEDMEGFIGTKPKGAKAGEFNFANYQTALTACETANVCEDDLATRIYGDTGYDAMWVGALAVNMSATYSGPVIKTHMAAAGMSYVGATGNKSFDSLGDPVTGDYEVYQFIDGDMDVVGTWTVADGLSYATGKADIAWPGRTGGGAPGFEAVTLIMAVFSLGTLVIINRKRK